MSPDVRTELLDLLVARVRSADANNLTTAEDLRVFLARLVEVATAPDGGGQVLLTSPNGTAYHLAVSDTGAVSAVRPAAVPPADPSPVTTTGYAAVQWGGLVDSTDQGAGTIERTTGGYNNGGSGVGSLMSGATAAAVKASLRFTLHAADGEYKCGFNYDRDRDTGPFDVGLKLAIHVNPASGVRAIGSAYGYPYSDYVPLVEGGIAQLDILQDGSAAFSIDGTGFATKSASTLSTDGLYADCWLYTPGARVSNAQTLFGNPVPTGL